jgi:hypothetical protein
MITRRYRRSPHPVRLPFFFFAASILGRPQWPPSAARNRIDVAYQVGHGQFLRLLETMAMPATLAPWLRTQTCDVLAFVAILDAENRDHSGAFN